MRSTQDYNLQVLKMQRVIWTPQASGFIPSALAIQLRPGVSNAPFPQNVFLFLYTKGEGEKKKEKNSVSITLLGPKIALLISSPYHATLQIHFVHQP